MLKPLPALQKWILEAKRKKNSLLTFQQCFLGNKYFSYFFFRLRYFLLTNFLNLFSHLLEFYLLTLLFSYKHLRLLILIRVFTLTIKPIWWGLLELMRERIRLLFRNKENALLAQELGHWFVLSFIVGHIFIILSMTFICLAFIQTKPHKLMDLYIATIFFELSFSLFVDTYRAGIYAVYRVSIRILNIIVPSILCVLVVLSLYKILDQYIILINVLLTGSVGSLVSFYYIKKSYVFYNWPQAILPSINSFKKFIVSLFCLDFILPAIASLFMNIEVILPFIILLKLKHFGLDQYLFFIFYLVNPLLRMTSSWAKLFYFDIQRYKNDVLSIFVEKFQAKFLFISPLLGLFLGVIAYFLIRLYFHHSIIILALFFGCYFVIRAAISYLQIIAFCQRRYFDVIISGLIILSYYLLLSNEINLKNLFLMNCLFLFSSFFYILHPRIPALFSKIHENHPIPFVTWFQELLKNKHPTKILKVSFCREINLKQKGKFIENIGKRKNVFCLDEFTLLFFGDFNSVHLNQIFLDASGLLKKYRLTSLKENGREAFLQANENYFFHPNFNFENNPMHEIIARFKMDFPNGDYWTYDENKFEEYLSKNFSYDKNHTRLFMHNFRHYLLFPGSLKFFGEITVAVYYSSHNKPIVFVFPVSKEKK